MSIPRGSIVLFAILCFVLNSTIAEERIAHKKHWNFTSGSELFFNPKSYRQSDEYHSLIYILCDDQLVSQKNCTVVQDTLPERSCSLRLQPFNEEYLDFEVYYLESFPFGSTWAVIVWYDYRESSGFIKCTILDFTTCVRKDVLLVETRHPHSHSDKIIDSTYFVDLGDSFELVMLAKSRSDIEYNRYVVDATGNIVTTNIPWTGPSAYPRPRPYGFRAIVADSESKAYMSTRIFQETRTLITLRNFHGPSGLWIVPANISKIVESTAHETLGIAFPVDHRVDVLRLDHEYKLKLNTSVPYDIRVEYVGLRNLADGGFALLTVGSKNVTNGPLHPDTYYLTKVDAEGKVVGTIKTGPEPNTCGGKHLALQVFESEAKEYCAVIVCSFAHVGLRKGVPSSLAQLDEVVKCFTDEDFSKSKM